MMRDLNLWSFSGTLTKDPAFNHLDDGTPVCHVRLAVHTRREESDAMFVDVTAWRRDAENCAKYLHKGRRAFVSGPLVAMLVTLKDGRPILDLAVDAKAIEFLSGERTPADDDLSRAKSRDLEAPAAFPRQPARASAGKAGLLRPRQEDASPRPSGLQR